jgi:hypothetical protein
MTRIEKQILTKEKEIAALRRQQQQIKSQQQASKPKLKPGRKPLNADLLQRIKLEALTKPLPAVALKYDVSLRSLYNHGIKRKVLDAEIAALI